MAKAINEPPYLRELLRVKATKHHASPRVRVAAIEELGYALREHNLRVMSAGAVSVP